jgi:predicted ATPase
MITKLHVRNYRSIGAPIELDLGRLTALVGPSGAGKSNLADALRLLADTMRWPLAHALAERGGIDGVLHAGADPASGIYLRADVANEHGAGWWSVTIVPENGHDGFRVEREEAAWTPAPHDSDTLRFLRTPKESEAPPAWAPMVLYRTDLALPAYRARGVLTHLADELHGIAVYAILPDTLRAPQAPDPSQPMANGGENWASTLVALEEGGRGKLVTALRRLVGDIHGCDVLNVGGRHLVPRFRHQVGGEHGPLPWFAAAQESDGTLRLAGILTALFQRPHPTLLGFDEPELAIHAGALAVLYRYLVEGSEGSQVLLTTHSPELLDRLATEDLRLVERPRGATTVARVDPNQRERVKPCLSASETAGAGGEA